MQLNTVIDVTVRFMSALIAACLENVNGPTGVGPNPKI